MYSQNLVLYLQTTLSRRHCKALPLHSAVCMFISFYFIAGLLYALPHYIKGFSVEYLTPFGWLYPISSTGTPMYLNTSNNAFPKCPKATAP